MGQTDSQFKAFIRFVLKSIKELRLETDEEKRNEKTDEIIQLLQETLED